MKRGITNSTERIITSIKREFYRSAVWCVTGRERSRVDDPENRPSGCLARTRCGILQQVPDAVPAGTRPGAQGRLVYHPGRGKGGGHFFLGRKVGIKNYRNVRLTRTFIKNAIVNLLFYHYGLSFFVCVCVASFP